MTIETKGAVGHLLLRIARDPRLAWYFDPLSRSMELLTQDYCAAAALDLEHFRAEYYALLKFEGPAEREPNDEEMLSGASGRLPAPQGKA